MFLAIKNIQGVARYLIEKKFLDLNRIQIAQIKQKYYFTRKQNPDMNLTQIMSDIVEDFGVSEKTVQKYIYGKTDISL